MTLESDNRTRGGSQFVVIGPGMAIYWLCMGCNTKRSMLGAEGRGVRRRCAICVAKRKAKEPNDSSSQSG